MSKRLQVLLPKDEYKRLNSFAQKKKMSISDVVREALRQVLAQPARTDPEKKLAALLRFSRYAGPTGDIEQLLHEIEEGRR